MDTTRNKDGHDQLDDTIEQYPPAIRKQKGKFWPIVATGAGLFSDGYLNNVIGSVNTILKILYPTQYANSPATRNVSSIAFVGTVVGQLAFGYISDHHSRKLGMVVSTLILILMSILSSASWGAGGSIPGMLAALTAYRFFIGIGIGGEYPAGSVACAEASNELKSGHRNRYFVLFTNFMIDFGFVVSAFTPLVMLWICGTNHLGTVWRVALGLGAIPPMSIFYLRLKLEEPEQFTKNTMRRVRRVPYLLIIRFYWFRLLVVSIIWFIYDFSAYSFGLYSSTILDVIIPDGDLYKTFGWNVVINLFYLPGSMLGALSADYFGPRVTLTVGVILQAVVGYIMAGLYSHLKTHIAGFVVVYGIFLTLGEFGPGDCIGLIASKTCATSVRGQYYGIAAAIGKIGAFVGTYVFPVIISNAGGESTVKGLQTPFWVSASLAIFSGILAITLLPKIGQDVISTEDDRFRDYLESHGWDVAQLGDDNASSSSTVGVEYEYEKKAVAAE
ncbi:major facilitator superfamily domain-containing protein [Lipomyces kononenkoae]|uniref:Major facilitator superfamily domain-containing protein n=1 Tax=Lipomyces kononenkoae TaxID=34357 RepID=A0ACC3TBP6_LIPKO